MPWSATDAPGALRGAVVAIGNFDGVHRGHRAVIATALDRAATLGRPAAALTFEPHPRGFFRPDEPLFRLTDERSKLRLLAATGLDGAIVLHFDAALARLSAEDFIARILLERLAVSGVVIGFDFHFGLNRQGSPDFLVAQGASTASRSTSCRASRTKDARCAPGRSAPRSPAGRWSRPPNCSAIPGSSAAKSCTATSAGANSDFRPPTCGSIRTAGCEHGIYAVRVGVGDRHYDGVANFGRRPMFDAGYALLEVFLFDFSGDLYGKVIDVAFIGWIRPELKFDSLAGTDRADEGRLADRPAALARAPDAFPRLGPHPGLKVRARTAGRLRPRRFCAASRAVHSRTSPVVSSATPASMTMPPPADRPADLPVRPTAGRRDAAGQQRSR